MRRVGLDSASIILHRQHLPSLREIIQHAPGGAVGCRDTKLLFMGPWAIPGSPVFETSPCTTIYTVLHSNFISGLARQGV